MREGHAFGGNCVPSVGQTSRVSDGAPQDPQGIVS